MISSKYKTSDSKNKTDSSNIFVNYKNFPTLEILNGNGYLNFEAAKKKLIDKLQQTKQYLVKLENENQIIPEFNIKVKDIDSYYDKIVDNLQSFVDSINDKIESIKEIPKMIVKKEQEKPSYSSFSSYLHKNSSQTKYRETDKEKILGIITNKDNSKLSEFLKKYHKKQPNCYFEEKKETKINKLKLKGFFSNTFNEEITSTDCLEVYKIILKGIENCTNQLKLILKKYATIILNQTIDISDDIIINYKLVEKSQSQSGGNRKYKKTRKTTNKTQRKTQRKALKH